MQVSQPPLPRRCRRRAALAAAGVALLMVVTGCASQSGVPPPGYLNPPPECLAVGPPAGAASASTASASIAATAAAAAAPASGEPLAADFVPTSALLCTVMLLVPGQRKPGPVSPDSSRDAAQGPRAVVKRSVGPFGDLVRALRTPPTPAEGDVVCTLEALMPFAVTLIDAAGRSVTPALPADPCRRPDPAVRAAIGALDWQPVESAERTAN